MSEIIKATVEPISANVYVSVPLCAINEFYELMEISYGAMRNMEDIVTPVRFVHNRFMSQRFKMAAVNLASLIFEATGAPPEAPE